jgi:hypothetical protein
LTAVRYDNLEVFNLLINESNDGWTENIDMGSFQIAAKYNSKEVAGELIKTHNATFLANATDENGKSLVCLATENNSVDVLKVRCHN